MHTHVPIFTHILRKHKPAYIPSHILIAHLILNPFLSCLPLSLFSLLSLSLSFSGCTPLSSFLLQVSLLRHKLSLFEVEVLGLKQALGEMNSARPNSGEILRGGVPPPS